MKTYEKIVFLFSIILMPMLGVPTYAEIKPNRSIDLTTISDDNRLKLAQYLIGDKQADKAIHVIIFKKFKTAEHIIQSQILLADALYLSSKKDIAVRLLREMLAAKPQYSIARFKLAQMLFAMDNHSSAKHHFEILSATYKGQKPQQIIDGYLKKIAHSKAWFFNVSGSYFPTSNFNGGVTKDVYYCDDFGATADQVTFWRNYFTFIGQDCDTGIVTPDSQKPKTGFVLNVKTVGGYRFKISDNMSWTVKTTGHLIKYPHTVPSVLNFAINSGPTISINDTTKITLDAGASIIISQQSISKRDFMVSIEVQHAINPQLVATSYLSINQSTHFVDNDLSNITARLQNNLRISIDNTSFIKIIASVQKGKYHHPNHSFTEINGGIGYYKEFPFGITIYSEATLALRHKNLEDIKNLTLSAKLTKRDLEFWGFAPELTYTYNAYDSSINRFDKASHTVNIGITRSF